MVHKNGRKLLPATVTQKVAIAAINHGAPVSNEADCAVSQSRCLPYFGGNAGPSIKSLGNVAVARAIDATVHGLQHPAQPMLTLRGQSSIWGGWTIIQNTPKANNRFDTIQTGVIERYDSNEGRVRRCVINE